MIELAARMVTLWTVWDQWRRPARLRGQFREVERLQREMLANQRQLITLTETQSPLLIDAVVAAVNGGIGGRVGLGFQKPGYGGQTARY